MTSHTTSTASLAAPFRHLVSLVLATVLVKGPTGLTEMEAQQLAAGSISDHPTCDSCVIEMTLLVTLGDDDGAGALAREPAFVLRTHQGLWVVAEFSGSHLAIFSPDGGFVRTVGRRGQGPGEFLSLTTGYVSREGTIHVFDMGNRRETVYDEDFSLLRTALIPDAMIHRVVEGPDGHAYVNAEVGTPELIGLPVHTLLEGALTRSFGSTAPLHRPDAPWLIQRVMAPDSGGVWISSRTQYRLEHWSAEGVPTQVWERAPQWFQPYLLRTPLTLSHPPQPWFVGLGWDRDRNLIAVVNVPKEDFAQHLEVARVTPRGDTIYRADRCADISASVLEGLDVQSGTVITRARFEDCVRGFIQEGMIYSYDVDQRWIPRIRVMDLHIGPR